MPQNLCGLHAQRQATAHTALLLVDVINPMAFPEAPQLLRYAPEAAKNIAYLKKSAREKRVPVIYANDNFGKWRSNLQVVVDQCLRNDCPGREIARMLLPDDEDYFVLKPKHSAFFSTTLDPLLRSLGVETIILTGFATDICVLFTANDAYMRDLHIIVPCDACASNEAESNDNALELVRRVLKGKTPPSAEVHFR